MCSCIFLLFTILLCGSHNGLHEIHFQKFSLTAFNSIEFILTTNKCFLAANIPSITRFMG
uniref:Uncharacterized protein n=1 Tax=Rhizophora mucronata TaxID=61149 RepID=A0A2P2JSB5_RHIMU